MIRPFDVIQAIRKRYTDMLSVLDERGRRLFVAAEARAYGLGGAYVVEQATGVARSTINRGIAELKANPPPTGRVRRVGGGRKKNDPVPALIDDLKNVVDSATRGDPMSPLLWISRSLEHVTEALRGIGYALSTFVVRWTLKSLGYRLQANRKTHEGGKHPDRNAQFLYIKAQKEKFVAAGRPILSIDAKKKEPIGN